MADFTDFNWQTGDYGTAQKFNSMVDNDRHLRERTDVLSFHWAMSRQISVTSGHARTYRIFFGGTEIATGNHLVEVVSVFRTNLDISATPIGLRTLEIRVLDSHEVLVARIYKPHQMNRASVAMSIRTTGIYPDETSYVYNVSLLLHREWQSW